MPKALQKLSPEDKRDSKKLRKAMKPDFQRCNGSGLKRQNALIGDELLGYSKKQALQDEGKQRRSKKKIPLAGKQAKVVQTLIN